MSACISPALLNYARGSARKTFKTLPLSLSRSLSPWYHPPSWNHDHDTRGLVEQNINALMTLKAFLSHGGGGGGTIWHQRGTVRAEDFFGCCLLLESYIQSFSLKQASEAQSNHLSVGYSFTSWQSPDEWPHDSNKCTFLARDDSHRKKSLDRSWLSTQKLSPLREYPHQETDRWRSQACSLQGGMTVYGCSTHFSWNTLLWEST